MLACVTVLALIGYAAGHAAMFWPPNWQDENGLLGLKSGQHYGSDYIAAYNWLMNHTTIKGEQTIDESMRTMKEAEGVWLKNNTPWLSPGSAYVTSPCGVLTIPRCLGTRCHDGAGGVSHRLSAEDFDFPNVVTTQWTIGSKVEVFWGVAANHGGGYLYRLCKVPKEGVSGITEECFQRTPLRFVGEKQWFQFGEDVSSRIYFLANRTDVGTKPAGSQWTIILYQPVPSITMVSMTKPLVAPRELILSLLYPKLLATAAARMIVLTCTSTSPLETTFRYQIILSQESMCCPGEWIVKKPHKFGIAVPQSTLLHIIIIC